MPERNTLGWLRRLALGSAFACVLSSAPIPLFAPADANAAPAAKRTPRQILDSVDDLFRGEASDGTSTMKIVTGSYTRELTIHQLTRGKDHSLVRILAPKKERGVATLRVSNDIWNYLPNIDRTVRLPASSMGNAWMGSHFKNEDFVKLSRLADDYTYEQTFSGMRNGEDVTELTLKPKQGSAVVWGKVVVVVRTSDAIPLTLAYYGEDSRLARTQRFSNVGTVGGRSLPRTVRMVPADKPGEYTEVSYQKIAFDVKLDDSVFSISSLKK